MRFVAALILGTVSLLVSVGCTGEKAPTAAGLPEPTASATKTPKTPVADLPRLDPAAADSWGDAVCRAMVNWRIATVPSYGLLANSDFDQPAFASLVEGVLVATEDLRGQITEANKRSDAPLRAQDVVSAYERLVDRLRAVQRLAGSVRPGELRSLGGLVAAAAYGSRQATLLVDAGQPDPDILQKIETGPSCGIALFTGSVSPAWTELASPSVLASREERWREDIDFIDRWLLTQHAKAKLSAQAGTMALIHRRLMDFKANVERFNDADAMLELQAIVTLFGEIHTGVALFAHGTPWTLLPIGLHWFSDGLYVVSADADEYKAMIGKKLVRIGGKPTAEVLAGIANYIPRENDSGIQAQVGDYMRVVELLEKAGATVEGDSIELSFVEGAPVRVKGIKTAEGLSVDTGPLPDWLQSKSGASTWLQLTRGAVYLRIGVMVSASGAVTSGILAELEFALRQSPGVSSLILDLRGNPGGYLPVADLVYRSVARIKEERASLRIVILADGGTLSAAQYLIVRLRQNLGAIQVGALTGESGFSMFLDVHSMVTPNNGLLVTFPELQYESNLCCIGLVPHEKMTFSGADFFGGRDPWLDWALTH